jgi:hypothetical protein
MKKLMFIAAVMAACGSSSSEKPDARVIVEPPDAGQIADAKPQAADADCIANPDPSNSDQIMNACTTATQFSPHPNLPLLLDDGGLPPLQ